MEEQKTQFRNRRSVKFFIGGLVISIILTSAISFFVLSPQAKATFPVFIIESQPDIRKSIWDMIKEIALNAAAVAWKKAYSYFLNKIAYDSAVYIASGGQGQKPLFITDFGAYVKEIGDGAAGEFLDGITKNVFGQSLCTFSPEIQLKIGVFARRTLDPEYKPTCSLSQISANVTRISKMTTADLIDFQHSFSYTSSELGAYLYVVGKADEERQRAKEAGTLEQVSNQFTALKDKVTGAIKTPREYIESAAIKPVEEAGEAESVYTGRPIADAFDIFTNTLISRLYKNIFEKGIAPSTSISSGNGVTTSGIAAARQYNMELAKPSFRVRGAVDVLNSLASCPTEYKEVNNCVIDDDFRTAVELNLTVKEALEMGYLHGDRTFGYDATGQEPEYYNGYPYRSLILLRKYRIIPSTWEVAATYIKNYVSPAKPFGLQELIDLYDDEPTEENEYNPFYHLVDPNWVLKSPETFCRREGPGPQLILDQVVRTEDTNGDGWINELDTPIRQVSRASYCADERTCIDEDESGDCRFYGYCVEEKPIWKFDGTSCEAYENSCQLFVDSNNKDQPYIQNSLNYDSCDSENAGCKWYCEEYNAYSETFVCSSEDYNFSGSKIYFDKDAQTCGAGDRNCNEYILMEPGANLAANSSFEVFDGSADDGAADVYAVDYPHWGWVNNGLVTEARSQPYADNYSLFTNGGGNLEYTLYAGSLVYGKTYTLSAYIQPEAACGGDFDLQIGGYHNGGAWVDYVKTDPVKLNGSGWQRIIATAQLGYPDVDPEPDSNEKQVGFRLVLPACNLYLDAVQLEEGEVTAYKNYATSNQIYETDKADNLIANGGFGIDNGTNYYADWNEDNYIPGDTAADGWNGVIIINDADNGVGDQYIGSVGGYQDVPVAHGSRYDVSGWVQGGAAPITTVCLDADHVPIADNCNLNADATDPRTQGDPDVGGGWQFISFGIEADNPSAAFVRVILNGSFFDDIKVASTDRSLMCQYSEIGCEMYDPDERGEKVPGVVTVKDYCDEQNDGCKSYKQMPVVNGTDQALVDRDGPDPVYLIAKSGTQCEAAYAGCEEFTNLDEVAKGGEGLEYYTYIRKCEKPNPGCATYYHWEGDEARGYELIAESLVGGAAVPPDTWDGSGDCDPAEPGCILYYAQNGNFWYRQQMSTITCSEDCHPLRNTLDGEVYNAIPSQGIRCPKSQAGCREYRGSDGYNIRKIIDDNFDDGDYFGWTPDPNITISTESLKAGGLSAAIGGGNFMMQEVTELIETGKTYLVEFWAKAVEADSTIQAAFLPDGTVFAGSAVANNQNWNHYILGPAHFDADVGDSEQFFLGGSAPFYIDNIILWETKGNNYLIYKSYDECPASQAGCALYYDRQGDEHYLKSFTSLCRPEKVGCKAVLSTYNSTNPFKTETLRRWVQSDATLPIVDKESQYCKDAAKGCTKIGLPKFDNEGRAIEFDNKYLIDDPDRYQTDLCEQGRAFCEQYQIDRNAQGYAEFKNPNEQTCEYRSGVNINGIVYDAWFKEDTNKFCPVEEYTCIGGDNPGIPCYGWGDDARCGAGGSCEIYYNNPQPTRVCGPQLQEYCVGGYRDGQICNSLNNAQDPLLGCDDPNTGNDGFCSDQTEICYGGYREAQPCDSDADAQHPSLGCDDPNSNNDGYCAERVCQQDNYCASDPDLKCQTNSDCPGDDECVSDECPDNQLCSEYWVGMCKNKASGCTEYRDPQDPLPALAYQEGQERHCAGGANNGAVCTANDDCDSGVCLWPGCRAECRIEYDSEGHFYRLDEECKPYPHDSVGDPAYIPGCTPYYEIESSVDTASCFGVVNPDEGCRLFNDASDTGGVIYDSDYTYGAIEEFNGTPYLCAEGDDTCAADSNIILKVRPDRVCNQWLYCKTSFTSENDKGQSERLCYDIGNCREIGSTGQCTKPIGEGQCDNDPARNCVTDNDCEDDGVCVKTPKFEHPSLPDPEYEDRAITPVPHPTDLTFDFFDEIDQAKYYSGYGKIGITWRCWDYSNGTLGDLCWRDGICQGGNNVGGLCRKDSDCPGGVCADDKCPGDDNICRVVHGYYPTASMWEVGFGLDLPNHDFQSGTAYPWEERNLLPGLVFVTDDDQDPTKSNYALKVMPNGSDTGARINLDGWVTEGSRFVLSIKMRAPSEAPIKVQLCYNNDDPAQCQIFGVIRPKLFWQQYTLPLSDVLEVSGVNNNTYLSIVQDDNTPVTDFYVDDVELQTLLEKKSVNMPVEAPEDERFVVRSCRLYPETNSPSCNYTKESSSDELYKIYNGWKGYCLEKDPHNSEICLQWWPVDIISGESDVFGGGEVVGYYGRAPLYYCGQVTPLEFRRVFWLSGGYCYKANNYHCPPNYYQHKWKQKDINNWPDKCDYICIPYGIEERYDPATGEGAVECNNCTYNGSSCKCGWSGDTCKFKKGENFCGTLHHDGYWTLFDGQLEDTHMWNEFGLGSASEVLGLRCDMIVKTVTATGENKAWASRINRGYPSVWDIGWVYDSDLAPYGSVAPQSVGGQNNWNELFNLNNPRTWDSDYTTVWGDPFTSTNIIGTEKQPYYWLSDFGWNSSTWSWHGPTDHGFNEVDYLSYARAGSPYSCKDHVYKLCDNIGPGRFKEKEQFSGPVIPNEFVSNPTGGGLGLKRLQRLFVDVYGLWIWGDGDCQDVVSRRCTYLPEVHVWEGRGCEVEADCDVAAGECLGKVCELTGEDPPVYNYCGCEWGACEAAWTCQPSGGGLCGLGICTGQDDACVEMRCEGGTKDGENCTSVNNNCSVGETCLEVAGTKCVDDSNPSCECPNSTCQVFTFCQDNGLQCNIDSNCPRHCDGILGRQICDGGLPTPDEFCEAEYGAGSTCQVVVNNCSDPDWRCANDIDQQCTGVNCSAGYTCNSQFYCIDPSVNNCECPNGYCADGICSLDDTRVCASNNTPQNHCAGAGVCDAGDSMCRRSTQKCNCEGGDTCTYQEVCGPDPFGQYTDCGSAACDDGSECCDKVCVVGGATGNGDETLEGSCCDSNGDCEGLGVDEYGNPIVPYCAEAVCSAGVNVGQSCGSSDYCIGADGECQLYNGVCFGGPNNGNACNNYNECCPNPAVDCPLGTEECADNVCVGGLTTGYPCSDPNDDSQCNPYTNIDECNPEMPSYCEDPDSGNAGPLEAYHQDFLDMEQCKFKQVSGVDVRPGNYPDDFCWVQPVIFNIKANDRTGTVEVTDSEGTVNLTWNTLVDPEQIPIRGFWIDWGDSTAIEPINFGVLGRAPRSDENGPYHTAQHTYAFGDCPLGSPCRIRIWMVDNWEFGSGYCLGTENQCSLGTLSNCGEATCWGVCQGGTNNLKSCQSNADCPGADAYCSGVFDGGIIVTGS